MPLEFHPLANVFPLMEGDAIAELATSIKENGLRDAITVYEGKILDGRNRYRACELIGQEPRTEHFNGGDPIAFVVDKNLKRRHLNESQRAMCAAKLATRTNADQDPHPKSYTNLKNVDPVQIRTTSTKPLPPTLPEAAKMFKVGRTIVSDARQVLGRGNAEDIAAVESGQATVTTVARKIRARENGDEYIPKARNRGGGISQTKINTKIWKELKAALMALATMPAAEDVVTAARNRDTHNTIVRVNLPKAINFLKEFEHAWTSRADAE